MQVSAKKIKQNTKFKATDEEFCIGGGKHDLQ
jgi:hypothetical protein